MEPHIKNISRLQVTCVNNTTDNGIEFQLISTFYVVWPKSVYLYVHIEWYMDRSIYLAEDLYM